VLKFLKVYGSILQGHTPSLMIFNVALQKRCQRGYYFTSFNCYSI